MKIYAIIFCVILFNSCCFNIKCAECEPETADNQLLVEFDTSDNKGFKPSELDSVYLYRYNDSMAILDSLKFDLSGRTFQNRRENLMESRTFDHFHFGKRKAAFYELEIIGHTQKYFFRDFQIQFIPRNPSHCCECDKSKILNVKINGKVIDMALLPFRIRK
jgi:hypothetical protein